MTASIVHHSEHATQGLPDERNSPLCYPLDEAEDAGWGVDRVAAEVGGQAVAVVAAGRHLAAVGQLIPGEEAEG
jgi:hypothetical protein